MVSAEFDKVAETGGDILTGVTLLAFISNYLMETSAQTVLDSIQSIRVSTHQALINQEVPSEVDVFFGHLFPIIAFDILQMDTWYE